MTITNRYGIVHLSNGAPVTDSLVIAREFERKHGNVLQSIESLIADGTIGRLEFKPSSYLNEQGKKQRMIELSERGALIAMPFIGGKKSRRGQVRLVDAFIAIRDEAARQSGAWLESRQRATVGYLAMSDALNDTRAADGKATKAHHYMNEAKLVNWVLFGKFECINRDQLSQTDLKLLEAVEIRNAFLIARERTYEQRKAELPMFLQIHRAKEQRFLQ